MTLRSTEQLEMTVNDTVRVRSFSRFKVLDLTSRIVPCALFILILMPRFGELYALFTEHRAWGNDPATWKFVTDAVAKVSTVCFLTLITVLFFIRLEPIEKAKGLFPRIMALAGTFLMASVISFPRANLPMMLIWAAGLTSMAGAGLSIFALAHLGRSFSLMAEARRLVTTGPYRIIRHPLYLFEGLATFGVLLQYLSPYTVLIFCAHVLIQLTRIRYEETVLQKAFPEYQAYMARTAKLIPKLY